MDVVLIRHAESANNVSWTGDADAFFAQRHEDPDITERGVEQAQRLAAHLATGAEGRVDELAASPMLRAVRTAAPVASALGLRLRIDVDVFEQGGLFSGDPRSGRDVVGYPGLGRARLAELCPGCVLPDAVRDDGWWIGAHEDAARADARAARVADALRARAAAEPALRLAIVTHGAFASRLLARLLGTSPTTTWFHHHNTGITQLELAEEQTILHAHNRLVHLGDLPSLGPPMAAV